MSHRKNFVIDDRPQICIFIHLKKVVGKIRHSNLSSAKNCVYKISNNLPKTNLISPFQSYLFQAHQSGFVMITILSPSIPQRKIQSENKALLKIERKSTEEKFDVVQCRKCIFYTCWLGSRVGSLA